MRYLIRFTGMSILLSCLSCGPSEPTAVDLEVSLYLKRIYEVDGRYYNSDSVPLSGPAYMPHNLMFKIPGRSWDNRHTVKEKFTLVNGVPHGVYKAYHRPWIPEGESMPINGKDSVHGEFDNGVRMGTWKFFEWDGETIWRQYEMKDNMKNGAWFEFSKDSIVVEERLYVNDRLTELYTYDFEGSTMEEYSAFSMGTWFLENNISFIMADDYSWLKIDSYDTTENLSTLEKIAPDGYSITISGNATGFLFNCRFEADLEVELQEDRIRIGYRGGQVMDTVSILD